MIVTRKVSYLRQMLLVNQYFIHVYFISLRQSSQTSTETGSGGESSKESSEPAGVHGANHSNHGNSASTASHLQEFEGHAFKFATESIKSL